MRSIQLFFSIFSENLIPFSVSVCVCVWEEAECTILCITPPSYQRTLKIRNKKKKNEQKKMENQLKNGVILNSGPMSCAHHQTFCLCVYSK